MEITLKEWNQKQPRPRCIEQVRRWVRAGIIYPAPRLDGREYLVQANAIKINPLSLKHHTGQTLMEKIHGPQKKNG
ncbi:excisionase [Candidatus Hamiltonella defensa]|uniref:Excisionase n=1 Tax=Candidatus Williamhamiltonella defendens TaxID=138072 RepID=A0A4P2SPV4_9ENTR|nr:excisionase [Candidatus Hamiltonella defensa]ASV33140.1 excisionase [Candidatus Hamiltonella defensa]ASV34053.1 excisionase [Candidatus Hamiltonella defensa]ASV34241.1 excisionase [Candidatus Hamiltonella defensa]AWK16097.1 excisionase [Candidatus Hamiltonella defensa]AWK17199.1 excisionase [Candidatus Hamiltonella defensa]